MGFYRKWILVSLKSDFNEAIRVIMDFSFPNIGSNVVILVILDFSFSKIGS